MGRESRPKSRSKERKSPSKNKKKDDKDLGKDTSGSHSKETSKPSSVSSSGSDTKRLASKLSPPVTHADHAVGGPCEKDGGSKTTSHSKNDGGSHDGSQEDSGFMTRGEMRATLESFGARLGSEFRSLINKNGKRLRSPSSSSDDESSSGSSRSRSRSRSRRSRRSRSRRYYSRSRSPVRRRSASSAKAESPRDSADPRVAARMRDNGDENGRDENATPADFDGYIAAFSGLDEDDSYNQQLAEFRAFFEAGDRVGAPLDDGFASVFNPGLRQMPDEEKIKSLLVKHNKPSNMGNLSVPKTNPAIYKQLKKGPQIVDMQVQKAQLYLAKALVPASKAMANIMTKSKDAEKPIATLIADMGDILKLGTAAFVTLSQARKEVIRNDMKYPVSTVCTVTTPVGQAELFGDDQSLVKLLKERDGEQNPLNACNFDWNNVITSDDEMMLNANFDFADMHKRTKRQGYGSYGYGTNSYGGYGRASSGYDGYKRRGKRGSHRYKPYHSGNRRSRRGKGEHNKSKKKDGESEVCASQQGERGVDDACVNEPKSDSSECMNDYDDCAFLSSENMNANDKADLCKSYSKPQEAIKLCNTPNNFRGGKIARYEHEWRQLTSDPWILETVRGYNIELDSVPVQHNVPGPLHLKHDEQLALDSEISEFIRMGVVEECQAYEPGSYYSNLFTREKENGSHRVILNLKGLTGLMDKKHFKMETVKDVIHMMRPRCKFASIDFKHAFYSIRIDVPSRKYLRFIWHGKHYQFTCMPQGLGPASRVFTKLLKPILAHLRALGIEISIYIDDSILIDDEESSCFEDNILYSVKAFDKHGYTANLEKSVLPILGPVCNVIKHLGFIFNSISMTVKLTDKKQQAIDRAALALLNSDRVTLQCLASFVGKLVATEPGFPHAPIYYKHIEIFKNEQLRFHRGSMKALVVLPPDIRSHILWWHNNVFHVVRHVIVPSPSHFIESDASGSGWGGIIDDDRTARGPWSADESLMHINVKELTAAFFMLRTFCSDMAHSHIKLRMDNTTAVACVNRQASTKIELMDLTREVWLWAMERKIHLSAEYLPGSSNETADFESRVKDNLDTEWMLEPKIFDKVCKLYGRPDVDMFASRLNAQIEGCYVSWHPDPGAVAVDAFVQEWERYDLLYLFPPFSVIGRTMQKIRSSRSTAVLILPMWPTQAWWPTALKMVTEQPVVLPKNCLWMPQAPEMKHPVKTLTMVAMVVSGQPSKAVDYRKHLSTSFPGHGGMEQMPSMGCISGGGAAFVVKSKLMNFIPLSQMC